MICETTDFRFPMKADIFYPMIEQGAYGNVSKMWVMDRTIAGNFVHEGNKEEVLVASPVSYDTVLSGRTRSDVRISSLKTPNAITNVIITNIRDKNNNEIYVETSGPRSGKSTIFEVATQKPFIGALGSTEYYSLALRRSENQAADV